MLRPAVPLVSALVCGLILGDRLSPGWSPLIPPALAVSLPLLLAAYVFQPRAVLPLGLAVLLLIGAARTSCWSPRVVAPPVPEFLLDRSLHRLSGIIEQEPSFSPDRTRLIIRLTGYRPGGEDRPLSGWILLTVKGPVTDFGVGDPVRFVSRLHPIEGYHNPGGYDFPRTMGRQGIRVSGFLDHPDLLILSGKNEGLWNRFSLRSTRSRVNRLIDTGLPPPLNSLARALLTGDQSRIPPEVRETFGRAGVSHLLAFSGLNLALVGGLAFYVIRFFLSLSERALLFLNVRFWAALGSFLPMAGYALLAGLSPSVARALLMVTLLFAALLLKKHSDILNNLAWAALVLLLLSPIMLFHPAFQLSFLSVGAIAVLLPRIWVPQAEKGTAGPRWGRRIGIYLWGTFCVSLVTQLATAPAVSWWFYQLSFVGLFSNMILVPLTGMLVVPVGLVALLVHPLSAGLASLLFGFCGVFLDWTWKAALFFASLPGAWTSLSRPAWPEIVLYYLSLLILFHRSAVPRAAWVLGVTLAATAGAYGYPHIQTALGWRPFSVTFLDVGHGSASVVQFPDGSNLLIDGGGAAGGTFDLGERVVGPFLRQKKITRLEAVVLTHPHPDHLNGLPFILERFSVGGLWLNGDRLDTEHYARLETLLREKKIPVEHPRGGWSVRWGEAVISVLHPPRQDERRDDPLSWRSQNNRSLVLKITCRDRSILLPADIEAPVEAELVDREAPLRSEILQVPHHGSLSSSRPDFIEAVRPRWAVVSARAGGRVPVPHPAVLQRYRDRNISVLRTDREGAVWFSLRDGNWTVERFLREGSGTKIAW